MNIVVPHQLAFEPPIRLKIIHLFCMDAVHVAAIERGLTECADCQKPLPKSSLTKCSHGVYKPSDSSRCCSVCHPTFSEKKIKRQIVFDDSMQAFTSVRIDESDLVLKKIRKKRVSSFDAHQFEKPNTDAVLLKQFFGNEDHEAKIPGFVTGMLRGPESPVKARAETPPWILNIDVFRRFLDTRKKRARAASILYLFYACGLSDAQLAKRCIGLSESAAKKQRQRLVQKGTTWFRAESKPKCPASAPILKGDLL
jgi:hypothetical protein